MEGTARTLLTTALGSLLAVLSFLLIASLHDLELNNIEFTHSINLADQKTSIALDMTTAIRDHTELDTITSRFAALTLTKKERVLIDRAAALSDSYNPTQQLMVMQQFILLQSAKRQTAMAGNISSHATSRNRMLLIGAIGIFVIIALAGFLTHQTRTKVKQLSYQESHDHLTKLMNRTALAQHLQQTIDEVNPTSETHAFLYVDLDQFKVVNDTCGHAAGDELILEVSAILKKGLRKHDLIARMGGDEFGILLKHCQLHEARRIAEELRRSIEAYRFNWKNTSNSVGISIGVVPITSSLDSAERILSAADASCFAAKDDGRNRIHVYDAADDRMRQRYGEMECVSQVTHALETDGFELHFQTIAPTEPTNHHQHIEILIRMRSGDEIIPPGLFLPAAERYNLASSIDRWVVENTLQWMSENTTRLYNTMVAINLSGQSLSNKDVLETIIYNIERFAIKPSQICFEITETSAIANLDEALTFIEHLKRRGCHFALDDFGSGLSSFAYLKTLPVDFLKIDGSFVRNIVDDPTDLALVRSINEIGHVMGKKTIAEFVEDDQIRRKLVELGVDYVQGYGIDKPRPLSEFKGSALSIVKSA